MLRPVPLTDENFSSLAEVVVTVSGRKAQSPKRMTRSEVREMPGAFGDAFDDSLWDVDAFELARRARESVERVWADSRV